MRTPIKKRPQNHGAIKDRDPDQLAVLHFAIRLFDDLWTDELVGTAFRRAVSGKKSAALQQMTNFWMSTLLDADANGGQLAVAHLKPKELEPRVLDRWFDLTTERASATLSVQLAQRVEEMCRNYRNSITMTHSLL